MGLIAIGDIHGCPKSLDALLHRLQPSTDDHLVFIGDYVDRGPDSKGVIDRLLTLRKAHTCTFLRGNHEAMMLDYLDHEAFDLWSINGGLATMRSYLKDGSIPSIPTSHEAFVRNTRMYLETEQFIFVHAGLKAELTVAENLARDNEKVFLWERSHLRAEGYAWEKTVVCGHTPHAAPVDTEPLICIDTGCVYHQHHGLGRLCAVRLPERDYVMVPYQD